MYRFMIATVNGIRIDFHLVGCSELSVVLHRTPTLLHKLTQRLLTPPRRLFLHLLVCLSRISETVMSTNFNDFLDGLDA